MKHFYLLLVLATIIGCASQETVVRSPQSILADRQATLTVPIATMRETIVRYVIDLFQTDLKNQKIDPEETSLRDHTFRYRGKTHPPIASSSFTLTEKEFGKIKLEVEGPLDILEDTPTHFLSLYRQTLFDVACTNDQKCTLSVKYTKPLAPIAEEVRVKTQEIKQPLWFNSLVLDVDASIEDSIRDVTTEWILIEKGDPTLAKSLREQG